MQFYLHIIVMSCLFLFPILGYNFVFGKGKILHFGQEAQNLTAVYTIWVLVMQYQQPFFFAVLSAAVLVTAMSCFLAWLSFRLEPDGLGVMSIALHLGVLAVVLNWQSVTRGALGIPRIPRGIFPASLEGFTILVLLVVVVWIFFLRWLDRGSLGRDLAALSENEWHAEALGIHRKRVHTIAFLVSGLGAIIAGTLYPPYLHLLTPTDYTFPAMIFFLMCVVAGGSGPLWGVTIATVSLLFLKEGLRFVGLPPDILGPVQLMLFGVILYVAVWLRRDTLFPHQRSV